LANNFSLISSSRSLTHLADSDSNAVDCVLGVVEWRQVVGAPVELRADTGENTVLVVILRGQVTSLDVHGREHGGLGHEALHLHHGHLGDVADVAHSLELLHVAGVVHEVEHEVVLHRDVECLHLFGLGAALRDSGINRVLSFHEGVVLVVKFVDDARGVDALLVASPVDLLVSSLDASVVEVEHGRQLRVGFLGLTSV